jgi:hypothetical protein
MECDDDVFRDHFCGRQARVVPRREGARRYTLENRSIRPQTPAQIDFARDATTQIDNLDWRSSRISRAENACHGSFLLDSFVARDQTLFPPDLLRSAAWEKMPSLEEASNILQAFARCRHLHDPQSEVPIHQHYLSARHDLVSHNQVDRVRDVSIQFHDIARTEVQDFPKRHFTASETQSSLEFHVHQ